MEDLEATNAIRLNPNYLIIDIEFYRRGFSGPYLKCIIALKKGKYTRRPMKT